MLNRINTLIARLVSDQTGLTAVEYAVLGALIVTAIGTVTGTFSTELNTAFANIIH